jgi:ferredoxin
MEENIVVGSGITGIITSLELLNQDKKVVMFDLGKDDESNINDKFENNYQYKINRIKKLYKKIKKNFDRKDGKYFNGSNYIFETKSIDNFKYDSNEIYLALTEAKGGLANIWGANFCQPRKEDLKNWPIKYEELQSQFKKIYNYIPTNIELSNFKKLEQFKNMYSSYNSSYEDEVTNKFFNILKKNEYQLNKEKIFFNKSFLAVGKIKKYHHTKDEENMSCQKCGFCMHNCPYKLIFNPRYYLEELNNNKNFTYYQNYRVNSLVESNGLVNINYTKDFIENKKISTKKVFLCAGPIQDLIILNNSNLIDNKKIFQLKETQQFIFLAKLNSKNNSKEFSYSTLSKINIHMLEKTGLKKIINFQIYPYSEIFLQSLINIFGSLIIILQSLFFKKLNNFVSIQGFLHSDYSNKLILKYNNKTKKFVVTEDKNLNLKDKIKETVNSFSNIFCKEKNISFYKFPIKITKTGQSYHVGSIFPISKNPTINECDLQGRLKNTKNIHILDSSILPDIPATSFTFLTLANALRIINSLKK